jgi:hypothetical protein
MRLTHSRYDPFMWKLPLALMTLRFLCAVLVFSSGGCKGDSKGSPLTSAPGDAGSTGANTPSGEGLDPAISDKSLPRRASGTMDVHNRYATTLMLTEEAQTRVARCSGILLNPRVALTAASCVCPLKKNNLGSLPERRLIDATACAQRIFLRTVRYGAVKDLEFKEETTVKSFQTFEGQIRPHPEFKLALDAQGEIQSSHADLAVIVLDSPVKEPLRFIPLGESEVRENEMLIMAGYPVDARFGGFSGIRYFRQNKVTQILGAQAGRILYEQQAPFLYNSYTGGPCFREEGTHQWLVGIASIGSDRELSFTSTYLFRDWLRDELQRASLTDSNSIPSQPYPR